MKATTLSNLSTANAFKPRTVNLLMLSKPVYSSLLYVSGANVYIITPSETSLYVVLVVENRNSQDFSTSQKKEKETMNRFFSFLPISELVLNSDRGRLSDLNNISIINHSKLWLRELRVTGEGIRL